MPDNPQPFGSTEDSERRILESLQRVTDAALAYLPVDELLDELLVRIREVLFADTAAILLLEPDGEMLAARAAKGIEEEVEQGVRIPVGGGFAGRIAAERRPIAIPDVDHGKVLNPILLEKGIKSLLGVPLLVEGRVIGVLHVGALARRDFTAEDRDVLQLAADRAALAIDHARLYEERRLAETLQRRLLPEPLPATAGLELGRLYLPAAGAGFGGDWYDVFRLGRGRYAVVVGDVVGHGVAAAAIMAQLRTALRAYASEGHPPAAVLDLMNGLMCDLGPAAMTTLAYLVLDPEAESVEVANAGHLPPLVIGPDGRATYLPLPGCVALGATASARYRSETFPLPVDATVVLYTDGLVETRGESIDQGLERLLAVAERIPGPRALCTELASAVPDAPADDIAVIAARFSTLPDRIATDWPADTHALTDVRHVLRRWLRDRGVGADEAYDITVACQEACANAVEHAYGPGRRSFAVETDWRDATVRVTVRDRGRWRPARGANRGRGLPLMNALMDSVEVRHTDEGTVVVLERATGGRAAVA